MNTLFRFILAALAVLCCAGLSWAGEGPLRLGLAAPLTGDVPKVGESSRQAVQLRLEQIMAEGGLLVGERRYPVEVIIEDTEARPEAAVSVVFKLIEKDGVIAIIGPQGSRQALPAGGVANDLKTPMITPWPTNPEVTIGRPYVFRVAFVDDFQARMLAAFAAEEMKAERVAILFDLSNDYSKGLADLFRAEWTARHGQDAVVAFESHGPRDQDFSAQLSKIVAAGPDVLVLPAYYNFAALIVRQARQLGYNGPILGSDAWASPELAPLCGKSCQGAFFSSHYTPKFVEGRAGEFVRAYEARFGETPDDVAALTADALDIALSAIQKVGQVEDDVAVMRQMVRDNIAATSIEGVTGRISFDPEGDPVKCALMVQIGPDGGFDLYKAVCPDAK